MALAPQIDGAVAIHSSPVEFAEAFRQRVVAGLLMGQQGSRANYQVVEASSDHLRIHAADWWTAINVGLNELDLQFPRDGFVHYHVQYWRWAVYAIGLSAILGLIGLLL